jgi:hypothetical protein
MPQGKELALSLCKMVDLWPSLANNCLKRIWANPFMKNKCWRFCIPLNYGILISWGNNSKLRQTIKASSTFWNNAFPPRSNKNGSLSSLDMIMRSSTRRAKTMSWRMHFPGNLKMKDPFFLFSSLYLIGYKLCTSNGYKTPKVII